MDACAICGANDFADGLAKGRHMKSHKPAPETAGAPAASPVPEPSSRGGAPAVLPEWRQYPSPYYGQRSIKMLRPICHPCQDQENISLGWWFACPHDPYVSVRQVIEKIPVFADMLDDEGQPTGRKRQVSEDTVMSYVAVPNVTDIALTPKVNGGKGVAMAQAKGFISPSELRSPHFPDGIAEACQYRNCWKQGGLHQYVTQEEEGPHDWGTFCRQIEARLVWKAENPGSGALEVGFDTPSRQRRRTQLSAVPV